MILTNQVLQNLKTMLRVEFKNRMAELGPESIYNKIATIIQSNTISNTYGWLGQFPQLREWVGDRVIKDIAEAAYQIVNKKYEATLGIDRSAIEDDNIGQYSVLAREMADEVERFLNQQIANLLANGFTNLCFDGQSFFDTDHPVYPNVEEPEQLPTFPIL